MIALLLLSSTALIAADWNGWRGPHRDGVLIEEPKSWPGKLVQKWKITVGEALDILRDAYCHTIGVEYMHIQEPAQKKWIQANVEGVPSELTQQGGSFREIPSYPLHRTEAFRSRRRRIRHSDDRHNPGFSYFGRNG